jgi:hypothetical protein
MRNVLAVVPKGTQEMVASIIRTIFAHPTLAGATARRSPRFAGTHKARVSTFHEVSLGAERRRSTHSACE